MLRKPLASHAIEHSIEHFANVKKSTSAMSMERISKAVPASNPFSSMVCEISSGFSSTFYGFLAEPMVETIPSPTRAIIVSSPAPPIRRSMFALTVTRALALTSIPSLDTAATTGVSITLGKRRIRRVNKLD